MLILRDHTLALDGIRWQRLSADLFEVYYPAAAGLYRGTVRVVGRRLEWVDGAPSDDHVWQSTIWRLSCDLDEERAGRAAKFRMDAPAERGAIDAVIGRWWAGDRRAA